MLCGKGLQRTGLALSAQSSVNTFILCWGFCCEREQHIINYVSVFIQFGGFFGFLFICKRDFVLSVLHLLGEHLQLSGNLCLCSSWWQEFAQDINSPLVIEQHLLVWSGKLKRNSTVAYLNCLWSLFSSPAIALILVCCLYLLTVNSRVVKRTFFFLFFNTL